MKNKTKIISIICTATLLMVSLTGCQVTSEVVDVDTKTVTIESDYETGQTQIIDIVPVPGETFSIKCTYDTGDYALEDWRVTANKTINMTVNTIGLPDDYTVHMEHMHADIVLKATEPQLDGITQDSMDDSDHRIPSKGFPINDKIAYNNIFAIEGYTNFFYQMWGYACGNYGSVSSSYQKMTEGNIRNAGTYAEKLIVIYDLVITTPECEDGYVVSVKSEVLIPLVSEIKTVTKDFWSGEIVNDTTE